MKDEDKTVKKESKDRFEEVTFLVHPRPSFQSERSPQDLTKIPLEKVTVLLSPLNARNFRTNPIQETFYSYWYHTAKAKKTFNDFLDDLWDERNQKFRLPRYRKNVMEEGWRK